MEVKPFTWHVNRIAVLNYTINNYSSLSPIDDQIEKKINQLAELEVGWHFGEGKPPSKQVIQKALELYKIGRNFMLEADIFPAIDGGIVIVFYGTKEYSVEIEIDPQTKIHVSYEKGIGFNYKQLADIENSTGEEIRRICQDLSIRNLSDSFIQDFSIKEENVSSVPALEIPQAEVFLSSIESASTSQTFPYVTI